MIPVAHHDRRLADEGDGLTCAVESGLGDRHDVVGSDDVRGSEEDGLVAGVGAARASERRPDARVLFEHNVRPRAEVIEVLDAQNGGGKGRGQAERFGRRKMRDAVHLVGVHLGLESPFHLAGCAGEVDGVLTAGHRIDGEALLLQPALHLAQVGLGHAEADGKLVGREPLMVVRRRGILLRGDQRLQGGFLRGGPVEDKGDSIEAGVRGEAAGIELRLSPRVERAMGYCALPISAGMRGDTD